MITRPRRINNHFSVRMLRIIILLVCISMIIPALMTFTGDTNMLPYEPYSSAFYFFEHLSIYYWTGLFSACLSVLIALYTHSEKYGYLSFLLLYMYTWFIPHSFFSLTYFNDAYFHMSNSLLVVKYGKFDVPQIPYDIDQPELLFYPASHVLYAYFYEILQIDPLEFMRLWGYMEPLLLSFVIIGAARMAGGSDFAFLSPIPVLALDWQQMGVVSLDSMAIIEYSLLIGLLGACYFRRASGNTILLLGIIASITMITDPEVGPLTTLSLILALVSLIILWKKVSSAFKPLFFILVAITALSLTYMFLTPAWKLFIGIVLSAISGVITHHTIIHTIVLPTAAPSYSIVNLLRIGQLGGWFLALLALLAFYIRKQRHIEKTHFFLLWVFSVLLILSLSYLSGIGISSGAAERILEYPPLFGGIFFAAYLSYFRQKGVAKTLGNTVLILVLAGSFVLPITQYAGASFEYVPPFDIQQSSWYLNYQDGGGVASLGANTASLALISTWASNSPIYPQSYLYGLPDKINSSEPGTSLLKNLFNISHGQMPTVVMTGYGWNLFHLTLGQLDVSVIQQNTYVLLFGSFDVVYSEPYNYIMFIH